MCPFQLWVLFSLFHQFSCVSINESMYLIQTMFSVCALGNMSKFTHNSEYIALWLNLPCWLCDEPLWSHWFPTTRSNERQSRSSMTAIRHRQCGVNRSLFHAQESVSHLVIVVFKRAKFLVGNSSRFYYRNDPVKYDLDLHRAIHAPS